MKDRNWRPIPVLLLAVLVMLMVACGPDVSDIASAEPGDKNADGYVDIAAQQLVEMLETKDFTLVNVHVPYAGEIERTDLFIPFDQIEENLDQLADKDAPIILYCRSGSMSTTAAKQLAELGYSNVYELDGGFNAWQAAGYEMLTR